MIAFTRQGILVRRKGIRRGQLVDGQTRQLGVDDRPSHYSRVGGAMPAFVATVVLTRVSQQ
jgi:hypothetical protein